MTMSSNEDNRNGLTSLQKYALLYLYSQEEERLRKELEQDNHRVTHHSELSFKPQPISLTIRELSTMISPSLLPLGLQSDDVYNDLVLLREKGYLEEDNPYGIREAISFSITVNGILYIKGDLGGQLSKLLRDNKVYEKKIEATEGSAGIKKWLR